MNENTAPADSAGFSSQWLATLENVSAPQIRAFLAFAVQGTLTRTAQETGKDISTVSRQIAHLDRALPFDLTRKKGKDTVPTNRALMLAELLNASLGSLEAFIEDNSDHALWVRIGAGATSLHSLVVPNLDALRAIFTGSARRPCRLHLANLRSKETVERLLDGRVDFGVVREKILTNVRGLDSAPIGAVSYSLVLTRSSAHELGVTSLSDIATKRVPVVTLSGRGEFKRELRKRLASAQFILNLTDELDFFADVVMAVRSNRIAGIVPTTALAHEPDERRFVSFQLPIFHANSDHGQMNYVRQFRLVWHPKLAFDKFVPKVPGFDPGLWFETSIATPMLTLFRSTIERAVQSERSEIEHSEETISTYVETA